MSVITWKTRTGKLGTILEQEFAEITLVAEDSDGNPIEFKLISGKTPSGMRVTRNGKIQGIPIIIGGVATTGTVTYNFTVRASTPQGVIADRSFSISISNQTTLQIFPRANNYAVFDDGSYFSVQFTTLPAKPNTQLQWNIVSGELPIDVITKKPITLSNTGLLSGNLDRLIDTSQGTSGFDVEPGGAFPYDFAAVSTNKVYAFQVQVSDGVAYDVITCYINLVNKGQFSADNDAYSADTLFLTADQDNRYVPIIITDPATIPVLQAGNNFSFKFDAIDPDQDPIAWRLIPYIGEELPGNLQLSEVTGWLSCTVQITQEEESKTYTFGIQAYKAAFPGQGYDSAIVTVNITALKDSNNFITWVTPSDLGEIINGTVSELSLVAVNNVGKELEYSKLTLPSTKLPQGLKLLKSGEISGRASFQFFRLDGDSSNITVSSNAGIEIDMTVQGAGVASGCKVVNITGAYGVKISPAIYVTEGSELTFVNLLTSNNINTSVTSLSSSTLIDGGTTTFDSTYNFTVLVEAKDKSVSSTKEFTVRVNNYNKAPFENIYLKALPRPDQRIFFNSIVNNNDIFPEELIYRRDDPWFGRSSGMRMLFLPGLSATTLRLVAEAIKNNHYNKRINFGNVKTARAVDNNFNTKYEVVYVEVEDNKQFNGVSTKLSAEPLVKNYYTYDNIEFSTIYPNSFTNMEYRLANGIGYTNKGAYPDWMTSPQENGRVLGLTRAIVLAYTVPGASKLIAYRIANNNINFNEIDFIADRYQIDQSLSANFNLLTNKFDQSKETIFDVSADASSGDTVDVTVALDSNGDTIVVNDPPEAGYGWRLVKYVTSNATEIPEGTIAVSVIGNIVTLGNSAIVRTGDVLRLIGTVAPTFAVQVPFDSINGKYVSEVATLDGNSSYGDGDTIIFAKQENFAGRVNDGWNEVEWRTLSELLVNRVINDPNPVTLAAPYFTNVPGYAEKLLNPSLLNKRAGVWKLSIDVNNLITLVFVQEIMLGQIIRINNGVSFSNTFMEYDSALKVGNTVPDYTPNETLQNDSGQQTTWDNNGTRFFNFRDKYAVPESGDKYIKFSQVGIYR